MRATLYCDSYDDDVDTKASTGKEFQEFLDAVVARESITGFVERLFRMHFDPFDHEIDVVSLSVSIKI